MIKISEELTDKEKITLTMTSKKMDNLKHKFIYYEKINVHKISVLPYFNNFACVVITDMMQDCPTNAKHVYYYAHNTTIPERVTHLTFDACFNQSIKGCIPLSVTHLTFGSCFNKSIKNDIPPSITHLIFGWNFDQSIAGNIPSSVTHLKFNFWFNQPIDNLPKSVTHLTLDSTFGFPISDITSSRIKISFDN